MWPDRDRVRRARGFAALCFIVVSGLAAGRAPAAERGSSTDSTAARTLARARGRHASSGALLAAAEEKERVPKPPSETRHKPAPQQPAPQAKPVEEDESSASSCMGDCIGSFFGSLFSSASPPPPPQPVSTLREESAGWLVGEMGWLRSAQTLWDRPGDVGGRIEAGGLPFHARIVVVETHATSGGMWLRVRPIDGVEPVGWIPASAVSVESPAPSPIEPPMTAPPMTTPAPGPQPPSPSPRERPTWGVQLALGGGGTGPAELNTEYQSGMFRAEAQYLRFLPKQWQSGAGLGWRYGEGSPQVLYRTSTVVEEPANSKLWMLDIGARGGQRYTDRSGFRFDWLLGPALYYVHERADVTSYDRSTMALLGTNVESLGRWAGGGDLRLGFGWLLGAGEIGLVIDGYAMGWKGHNEKALSTDFVQSPIHGFDALLTFTFPAP
jgi:hypothetical protein